LRRSLQSARLRPRRSALTPFIPYALVIVLRNPDWLCSLQNLTFFSQAADPSTATSERHQMMLMMLRSASCRLCKQPAEFIDAYELRSPGRAYWACLHLSFACCASQPFIEHAAVTNGLHDACAAGSYSYSSAVNAVLR